MNDPYKVLGVSPTATDEQVKNAYRELAKKYHPDNYANSPLSDLAQEKMKEINEAYDAIVNMRRNPQNAYQQQNAGGYGSYNATSSQFPDIRQLINQNRITEAEELLDGIPESRRDAEWYFLKGSVFYTKGWLDEAYNLFLRAVNMNPNNPEYRAALNQMAWKRNTGTNRGYQGDYRTTQQRVGGCSGCDMCSSLICADCCCECMGGDLIPCC